MSARAVKILWGRRSRGRGLHIVHSVMESIRRFHIHAGEDNTADLVTILLHPKGRDILLHSPSYLLVVSQLVFLDSEKECCWQPFDLLELIP